MDLGVWSSPYGVAANPRTRRFYSAELSGGGAFTPETGTTVSVIDGNLTNHTWNKVIKNIQITNDPNYQSSFIVVNSKTNKIYVNSDPFSPNAPGTPHYVVVIDGKTNTVTKKIAGINPTVSGMGINQSTNKIYVSNYDTDTVQVIDGNTDQIIKTIPIHTPQNVNSPYEELGIPSVSEKLNKIYVPNYHDGSVTVIDGATDTLVTAEDDLPQCPNGPDGYPTCAPNHSAVNDRTGKVYVAREGDNKLSVLDAKTYSEIAEIPLSPAPGSGPSGIVIDEEANLLYVADSTGFIEVVDGNTNKFLGTVAVCLPALNTAIWGTPFQPVEISLDPKAHRLYAACGFSGVVAVLKTFGDDDHDHWEESSAARDK